MELLLLCFQEASNISDLGSYLHQGHILGGFGPPRVTKGVPKKEEKGKGKKRKEEKKRKRKGKRKEGDILQFCTRVPKLMTHWAPMGARPPGYAPVHVCVDSSWERFGQGMYERVGERFTTSKQIDTRSRVSKYTTF